MRQTVHRGVFTSGFLALVVAVALLVSMSGCVGINIGSAHGLRGSIKGEGEIVAQSFEVESFDKLRIDGDYILTYTKSEECALSVEMQESLFDYLTVGVSGGELEISSRDGVLHNDDIQNRAPKLYVSAPTLSGMDFAGAIAMDDSDVIEGERLEINISGGGSVVLGMAVRELKIFTGGASSLELSGTAASARVDMSGAGELAALDLSTETAEISMSGTGSGSISCSGALDVTISGAGSVRYKGGAALTQHIAGVGSVEKVG